ncbi:unnamed protein product [Orchesella dallaii]|uniref:Uncharacterized protein n=1 Tax=Orchesella dallaii TaxID=48710 RepID=A0ABP1S150_9HEXA
MSLSLVRDYDRFMRYMVEVAGVYHSQARIEMQHTLNFEIKMAACMVKASDWLKDVPNDKSRIMTIQEMNNRYPSVQWIEFLQRITGFAITLKNETSIIVHNPVYLDCFTNLVNSTDLSAFLDMLDQNDWMSSVTKEEARDKAKSIEINTGYPEEYKDNTKLSSLYEGFDLQADQFYENFRKLNIGFNNPKLVFLRKDISRDGLFYAWKFAATFGRFQNSIQIPATLLQNPFFNISRPKYLNFGALGSSIGHEIIRGFDHIEKGVNNFENIENWWDNETKTNFDLRMDCMINQYSSFYSNTTTLNIDGEETLSKNNADNGGLKQAYRGYKYWVRHHGKENRLPGLNYTTSQLFWIAAAQKWCSVQKLDILRSAILLASHSPPEFRVNESFANNIEFSQDFKCPLGEKMNPVKKCEVW